MCIVAEFQDTFPIDKLFIANEIHEEAGNAY